MPWLASRACSVDPKARRASLGSRPEAMASSIWDCSSSSISPFKRSPRKALEIRDHKDMSCLPENPIDGQADGEPARLFGAQLFFSCRGEFVDAGPAAGVFLDPLGANPARFLHSVEGRVKGAFFS